MKVGTVNHGALMYAAKQNDVETVNALIKAGANVNLKDSRRRTALDHATEAKATDVEKLLIEADAK